MMGLKSRSEMVMGSFPLHHDLGGDFSLYHTREVRARGVASDAFECGRLAYDELSFCEGAIQSVDHLRAGP